MAKPAPITDEQEPGEREVADTDATRKLHEKFLRAFDASAVPQTDQRANALQNRIFVNVPGGQWAEFGWDAMSANMIRIEVNKVARGLEKITNDYRANRVTVDFRPIDDTDEDTAETLDGRFREDVRRSKGGESFDNCFDEGASGGMGAIRLINQYEDEYDPDNDHHVINFEPVTDADQSAYFDANSKRMQKSDAMWGCVIMGVDAQAFKDEWGEDRATDWPQGFMKPVYQWFAPNLVRVCEWYQVEIEKQERITLTNAITDEERKVWKDDMSSEALAEMIAGGWKKRSRMVKRRRVHKYILSGTEILKDCGHIAGGQIPIIPFYGKRGFVDNKEWFRGHVQLAKDQNRVYNTIVSWLMEMVSSSPKEVPVWYPQQIAGHSDDWERANIDRLAYLQINPMYNEDGSLAQVSGPVYKTTPPQVPPGLAALLQVAGADIAELTNADDGADEAKSNVSHEAMDLAATRTDEKSSGYMDGFRLFMERVGEVYKEMAAEVYVEEGRTIATRTADGEDANATLLQPKADNDNFRTINDFSQGKFNVIADVTESSATKRDKTVRKALGVAQIAGAETPLGQAALITAVSNMDGDGMDDFKKFTRRLGLQQGVFQPTEQEQQEAKEAAEQQGQAQPDPAEEALLARASKDTASAELDKAKTQTEGAKTLLTFAQATALGGPEKAPEVPTGLEPAEQFAKVATGKLHLAQADKITHDIHLAHREHGLQRIRTGHEIEMERRAQDLAEKQPAAA